MSTPCAGVLPRLPPRAAADSVQQLIAVAGAEPSTVRVASIVAPFNPVDSQVPVNAVCGTSWKQLYLSISRSKA